MEKLIDALRTLGYEPSEKTIASFELYMQRVLEWNEHVNLTAIRERDEFIEKHFIDSVCCIDDPRWKSAKKVIDVGTGAGFPGIPLAIVSPDKEFLLIDSLNKRIRILNEIIEELGLTNVTAIHGRAEELARMKQYRQKFDVCVSRAVSRLSVLSEYCLPFIKKEGWLVAYKGPDAEKELKDAVIGLALYRGDGALVYGTNTLIDTSVPVALNRKGYIDLRIDSLPLADGQYTVDLAIHRPDGFNYDFWRDICKLDIAGKVQTSGEIALPHHWTIG